MEIGVVLFLGAMSSILMGVLWLIVSDINNMKNGRESNITNYTGFVIIPIIIAWWFVLFSAHKPAYTAEVYTSMTNQNIDCIYTDKAQHVNLNRLLYKRVETGSTIVAIKEIPHMGLVWSDDIEYSVYDYKD